MPPQITRIPAMDFSPYGTFEVSDCVEDTMGKKQNFLTMCYLDRRPKQTVFKMYFFFWNKIALDLTNQIKSDFFFTVEFPIWVDSIQETSCFVYGAMLESYAESL